MLEIYDPQVDDEVLESSNATSVLTETQKDYGTPLSIESSQVPLSIDGRAVTVPNGTSVMRAAAEIDIDIPRLCATDRLKSFDHAVSVWLKLKVDEDFQLLVQRLLKKECRLARKKRAPKNCGVMSWSYT